MEIDGLDQGLTVEVERMSEMTSGHGREHPFASLRSADDLGCKNGHDHAGERVASVLLPRPGVVDVRADVRVEQDRQALRALRHGRQREQCAAGESGYPSPAFLAA